MKACRFLASLILVGLAFSISSKAFSAEVSENKNPLGREVLESSVAGAIAGGVVTSAIYIPIAALMHVYAPESEVFVTTAKLIGGAASVGFLGGAAIPLLQKVRQQCGLVISRFAKKPF